MGELGPSVYGDNGDGSLCAAAAAISSSVSANSRETLLIRISERSAGGVVSAVPS